MDWNAAIEHHREALKRILAMLAAMVRSGPRSGTKSPEMGFSSERTPEAIAEGWARPSLPRHLHRAVLRLLRPAEAAARRLVIVAARELVVEPPTRKKGIPTPPPPRFAWSPSPASQGRNQGRGRPQAPALPLFDPLPRWRVRWPAASGVPRISVPGIAAPFPVPAPPSPLDPLDATRLALRLAALARTLDDLPVAARRFALWQARIAAGNKARDNGNAAGTPAKSPGRIRRIWPFRPGRPPGQRPARNREPSHPVHAVLDDVHGLALWALEPADTS